MGVGLISEHWTSISFTFSFAVSYSVVCFVESLATCNDELTTKVEHLIV